MDALQVQVFQPHSLTPGVQNVPQMYIGYTNGQTEGFSDCKHDTVIEKPLFPQVYEISGLLDLP